MQAQQAFATFFKPTIDNNNDDQVEIIVSHGNLISYLATHALGTPVDAWLNIDIQQCGITEVVIDSEGWMRLLRHNDTGHLPAQLQAFV